MFLHFYIISSCVLGSAFPLELPRGDERLQIHCSRYRQEPTAFTTKKRRRRAWARYEHDPEWKPFLKKTAYRRTEPWPQIKNDFPEIYDFLVSDREEEGRGTRGTGRGNGEGEGEEGGRGGQRFMYSS
ncbi:hypothetical protein K440DRAFT_661021 [Wilcoxina mikolae CBS 423.85]|nr:hypothetical protein K440DRAFT_661021 [Wilcoxina mikolae CBS 423.85]